MDTTQKMLQTIINGQSSMKSELLARIDKLDKKNDDTKVELKAEIRDGNDILTERIDNLGKSLAYLEDDAPTIEEFKKLEKRVTKVEKK